MSAFPVFYMKLIAKFVLLVAFGMQPTYANVDKQKLDTVAYLLSLTEAQIDLAQAKLTIDKLVDPSINVEANLARLDAMITIISGMAGTGAPDDQKITAIRTYIYQAGPWNNDKPFKYDLDDPLGHHIPSKLLPNYMDSKLGNCVSMPFLFIALADRMGLNVTASTAPNHVFVKYTNPEGRTINLETTSGAHPSRNEWIRMNMPMTDLAIHNGVYLKTLSKRETVVVMATVLIEDALQNRRYGTVLNLANLLLAHYPEYAPLHVFKGGASYKMLEQNFYSQYPTPRDIPPHKRGFFEHLNDVNRNAFTQAEILGWEPERSISN